MNFEFAIKIIVVLLVILFFIIRSRFVQHHKFTFKMSIKYLVVFILLGFLIICLLVVMKLHFLQPVCLIIIT